MAVWALAVVALALVVERAHKDALPLADEVVGLAHDLLRVLEHAEVREQHLGLLAQEVARLDRRRLARTT